MYSQAIDKLFSKYIRPFMFVPVPTSLLMYVVTELEPSRLKQNQLIKFKTSVYILKTVVNKLKYANIHYDFNFGFQSKMYESCTVTFNLVTSISYY